MIDVSSPAVIAAAVAGVATVSAAVITAESMSAKFRRRRALKDLADLHEKLSPSTGTAEGTAQPVMTAPASSEDDPLTRTRDLIARMLEREAATLDELTDPAVRRRQTTGLILALGVLAAIVVPSVRSLADDGGAMHAVVSYIGAVVVVVVTVRIMAVAWEWAPTMTATWEETKAAWEDTKGFWRRDFWRRRRRPSTRPPSFVPQRLMLATGATLLAGVIGATIFVTALTGTPLANVLFVS